MKCERKVVRKFTLDQEKLMHSLCLQTEPIKENRRIPTRNRLDLQTLGSQQIVCPKISPISALYCTRS